MCLPTENLLIPQSTCITQSHQLVIFTQIIQCSSHLIPQSTCITQSHHMVIHVRTYIYIKHSVFQPFDTTTYLYTTVIPTGYIYTNHSMLIPQNTCITQSHQLVIHVHVQQFYTSLLCDVLCYVLVI